MGYGQMLKTGIKIGESVGDVGKIGKKFRTAANAAEALKRADRLKKLSQLGSKIGKVGGATVGGTKKIIIAGASAAKKAGTVCIKNPKLCAAGVLAVGTAAYAANKYNNLSKDKKDCMALCYPENWSEYVAGSIPQPNYKVEDGSSLGDPNIKYAPLYDDEEVSQTLCTPQTLGTYGVEEGPDSCNIFCEEACGFDEGDFLDDVGNDINSLAGGGLGLLGGFRDKLAKGLGIDLKALQSYAQIGGSIILVLCILSIAMKFM
jgi:hypothetical protein